MLNPVFKRAVFRLGRLFQAPAAPIIKPAVITAPETAVFHPAELQRRSAVRAVKSQKAQLPAAVAEQNKILSEQSSFYRSAFRLYFFRESNRPPKTPQHLAGRRPRTDTRHQFVFFGR
jgi:hypothetical protein